MSDDARARAQTHALAHILGSRNRISRVLSQESHSVVYHLYTHARVGRVPGIVKALNLSSLTLSSLVSTTGRRSSDHCRTPSLRSEISSAFSPTPLHSATSTGPRVNQFGAILPNPADHRTTTSGPRTAEFLPISPRKSSKYVGIRTRTAPPK